MSDFRIGLGVDAHRIVTGRKLVLGGVDVPTPFGLEAHSDGDVIAHAILDALFGAANMGDKGTHFPPTNSEFKDIASTKLLTQCRRELSDSRFEIVNIDVSVMCEEPKISPLVSAMQRELALALAIEESQISIKGTTLERMGFVGRKEGIAAMAVAMIKQAEYA